MILHINQTVQKMNYSEFIVSRGSMAVDYFKVKGCIGSPYVTITSSTSHNITIKLCCDKSKITSVNNDYFYRPYSINVNGEDFGIVYQSEVKESFFKKYEYLKLISPSPSFFYTAYPVGLGNKGSVCPIYFNDKEQVSEIHKSSIVYNGLHCYNAYIKNEENEDNIFATIFFALYMYALTCYRPGINVTKSVKKNYSLTTNKTLKSKYNPKFASAVTF